MRFTIAALALSLAAPALAQPTSASTPNSDPEITLHVSEIRAMMETAAAQQHLTDAQATAAAAFKKVNDILPKPPTPPEPTK